MQERVGVFLSTGPERCDNAKSPWQPFGNMLLAVTDLTLTIANASQVRTAMRFSLTDGRLPLPERERHVTAFLEYARSMAWDVDRHWLLCGPAGPVWGCTSIPSPGGSTILMIPHPATVEVEDIRRAVQSAVRAELSRGIGIVQVLLLPEDIENRTALTSAGFREIAILNYMERTLTGLTEGAPREIPSIAAKWTTYSDASHGDFRKVISESYRDSLDCPGLSGLRSVDDAIEGHKSAGIFDPAKWFLLAIDATPVACILFGQSPIRPTAELVYMGVHPTLRGKGIGRLVLDYGIAAMHRSGCQNLSLAVDSANVPAQRLYRQAGFQPTHSRRAMIYSARGNA